MDDFDFGFDFDIDLDKRKLNNRVIFNLAKSKEKLLEIDFIPKINESVRLISPSGGWSSCSMVMAIAEQMQIKSLYITTLRVGKKELKALENLNIENINIALGGISLHNGKYKYVDELQDVAKWNNWKVSYVKNHSKIILIDGEKDKIVIETSSNFNENPQIEQFCLTNNSELFNFYLNQMIKLKVWNW